MNLFNSPWFKKKENIPKIEPFSNVKDNLNESYPPLPSLPRINEDINQILIKESIGESKGLSKEIEAYSRFKPAEETNLNISKEKNLIPDPSLLKENSGLQERSKSLNALNGPDSIFIKLEKFQQAKKEINQIKVDLEEATDLIKKINDVNKKEELEFKEINSSLDSIKKRFNEIDSLVFDKV